MENVITLRGVYGKVDQTFYIQPCPNPRTGRLPDCVKTVDSRGDMILSENEIAEMNKGLKHFVPADKVFNIVDGTTFDLDDVVERAEWEAIEHCNWIAKDRFQRDEAGNLIIDGNKHRYGTADLYVERKGEIAKAKVSKKELVFRASRYVFEDTEADRIKKSRVLGRDLSNAFPVDVKDFLLEEAEKDPNKIISLYEDEDWKMHLFILDAIDRKVIRKAEGIYKYEDRILGASINATIEFLRDIRYKAMLDSIKRETYPEYWTKKEIEEAEKDITKNITHFDEGKDTSKKVTKK